MTEMMRIEEKSITDQVYNRVKELDTKGAIDFPKNYSVGNALKSAYLILQETRTSKNDGNKPVLEACTQVSIFNSLLDMVTQGLNPTKNQCYFIAFGNKLTLMRSYLGTMALTKRIKGVEDIKGYAVYSTDEFELDFDVIKGRQVLKKFKPNPNRKDSDLIGAFAIIVGKSEILHTEYMHLEQIKKAWNQGQMKGQSGAHKNFSDQMAVKTVINRACKYYANTSDDGDKIIDLINMTEGADRELEADKLEYANKLELDTSLVDTEIVDAETGEVPMTEEEMKNLEAPF